MTPEVWRKVTDIFSDCLLLPESERPQFLAKLETTDSEIAVEIRKLLKTYGQDHEFLEQPAIHPANSKEPEFLQPGENGRLAMSSQVAPEARLPAAPGSRWKSRTFWCLLAANVFILGCFVFTLSVIDRYRGITSDGGWWADPMPQGYLITSVDDPGVAAGILQVGDYILAINNQRLWLPTVQAVPVGDKYTMRVDRNGKTLDLVLTKAIVPNRRWYEGTLSFLLVAVTFFLTAVVVSVMRPGPKIITLAWAALASESVALLTMLLYPYSDFLFGAQYDFCVWMRLADGPHFAFAFHFFSQVFAKNRRGKLNTFLIWTFYVWGFCCAVYVRLLLTRAPFLPLLSFLWDRRVLWGRLDSVESGFYLVAPLSICIAIGYSYFRTQGLEERRRARWIAVGSLAGILPYLILRIGATLGIPHSDYGGPMGILPAALIPIATGYAILKHRLFDINVVLRRGLQYLVARNVLRFILALPAIALLYSVATNANRTIGELVLHNYIFVMLVVLMAVVLRYRQRLGSWLDRRFFREGYQQERILLALIDDLRNLDSIPEMGQRVVGELSAALHPECVYFFYYSQKESVYVKGFATDQRADGLQIPADSALPALLAKGDQALSLESFPTDGAALMSWSWLFALRADLVVPMNRADGFPVGFLLLGRKKSEEPYSTTDRSLLMGLARAMAVGCENLLLQERVLRQQRTNEQMRSRVEGLGNAWLQECPHCGLCFDNSLRKCAQDDTELILSSPVHRLLDGRYRLDRVLGRGGMGTVFAALDSRLSRNVAVKVVQAGRTVNSAWLRRFSREARSLARLSHENIVLTYDFGVLEDEVAFLIMELVDGTTLRAEIDREPILPANAAPLFDQLLEGVKAAHSAGIVHRDLKPENVLIARTAGARDRIKIADFGVAKWQVTDPESASLTLPGTIVGSLRYMSPEQLAGEPVDGRSDLFSVGVMAFEALIGKLPFGGATHAERLASSQQGSGLLETALRGEPDLQATLRKCLARDPKDRFPSAAALQAVLIPQIAACRLDTRSAEEYSKTSPLSF